MDPFFVYGPTYVSACENIIGVQQAASHQTIVVWYMCESFLSIFKISCSQQSLENHQAICVLAIYSQVYFQSPKTEMIQKEVRLCC